MALALSGAATAGLAAETTAKLTYGTLDVAGIDIDAGIAELAGAYPSGFRYDLQISHGDAEGRSMRAAEATVSYLFANLAGPTAVYDYAKTAGHSADAVMIGLSGEYALGGADLAAELVSDTDHFGDISRLTLEADYFLTEHLAVNGEIEVLSVDGAADSHMGKIGLTYNVSERLFLEGAAHAGDIAGAHAEGLSAGIGLSF